MCFEEFNRLFCKGMIKYALINIIAKLQDQGNQIKKEELLAQANPQIAKQLSLKKEMLSANPER